MRGKRYISVLLLMIFIAAVGCRLASGFICGCHEHPHKVEHICCHCSEHISTCSNHDQAIHQRCCAFHNISDNTPIFLSSKENKSYKLTLSLQLDFVRLMCSIVECVDSGDVHLFDDPRHLFHSTEWSMISYSLSSPPVLV